MVKVVISCFAFLLFIGVATSQESYVGIKGGFNLSSLMSDNSGSPELDERRTGALAIAYSYQVSDLFGVTLELGYIRKGTKINNDTLDYKFDYVTMPVLLDFYPIKRLKLSVGPELSFLARARNTVNDTTVTSIINTYDQRLEIAGTANVSYSPVFFMDVGARYSRSFTNVAGNDPILDRRNLFNEYLQFFVLLKIIN